MINTKIELSGATKAELEDGVALLQYYISRIGKKDVPQKTIARVVVLQALTDQSLINAIKYMRSLTNCGLQEGKSWVENVCGRSPGPTGINYITYCTLKDWPDLNGYKFV